MAVLQPLRSYESDAEQALAVRVRRCTFRRLSRINLASEPLYEVSCLYPDRRLPLPLGDLDSGMTVCNSCTASHIFRPDED